MSDNSTALPLQGALLQLNQFVLVAPTTVGGTLYGIAFTIFCLYAHLLVTAIRNNDRKKQAKFMLVYTSIIMICGLYSLVVNAWITQRTFIGHANESGGPYAYKRLAYRVTPATVAALSCQSTVDVLTGAIQIWRVWVIWGATKYVYAVLVLPVVGFFTFTALEIRCIIIGARLSIEEVARGDGELEVGGVMIQGATTVLCTILISLFLIVHQRKQKKLIGSSQGSVAYMNIVATLVESYTVESAWLLIVAITWNNVTGASIFFDESLVYVEIIAYLLVQYRVISGTAYEPKKGQQDISTLQFGEASDSINDDPLCHVPVVSKASIVPRVSIMA